MNHFFQKDVFLLILYPCIGVLLLFLVVLSDKKITRVTVFCWGLALIALAGYIAYQLILWRSTAAMLISPTIPANKRITPDTLAEYDRWSNYALWLVPFLTGSLGTNLISDALTKPLKYKKPFSIIRLASSIIQGSWMCIQFILVILISPFLFLIGIYSGLKQLRNCPRRWHIYAKLYRRSYLHNNRRAKQPWEQ